MSLDDKFGPCMGTSEPISDAERKFTPESLQVLDADSAKALAQYMATSEVLLAPRTIHSYCVVLWLVDEAGNFRFAVEELVDPDTGETVAVRPRGDFGKIGGTWKLGHPALLDAEEKEARIGGEILYDQDESNWKITNGSGRFGTRPHQLERHLLAVADHLKTFGVIVHPEFYKPRT